MRLSPQELQSYRERGFVTIPQLLDEEETARIVAVAEQDQELAAHAFDRADGEGGRVRLALWNHPGDDIYGVLSRTARLVDRA
jgi:ectoine hydroxylase